MKPKLFFCLLFLIGIGCYANATDHVFAQDTAKRISKKHRATSSLQKQMDQWKASYDDCTFTNQYTTAQRLKKYPFSKATKILAVSYPAFDGPNADIILNDTVNNAPQATDTLINGGLKIVAGKLNSKNIREIITLNQAQINKLTNIIFNTNYRKVGFNTIPHGACYEPRNAILFLDKNGKIYDYLEVCFACEEFSSKTNKLTVGIICTQKYDILRKYFISTGIKYGTKFNVMPNDESLK